MLNPDNSFGVPQSENYVYYCLLYVYTYYLLCLIINGSILNLKIVYTTVYCMYIYILSTMLNNKQ